MIPAITTKKNPWPTSLTMRAVLHIWGIFGAPRYCVAGTTWPASGPYLCVCSAAGSTMNNVMNQINRNYNTIADMMLITLAPVRTRQPF